MKPTVKTDTNDKLIDACYTNDLNTVSKILKHQRNKINDLVKPLHIAVSEHSLDLVKMLVEAGADMHVKRIRMYMPADDGTCSALEYSRMLIDEVDEDDVKLRATLIHNYLVMMNRKLKIESLK